jgi:hypothetical protein
VSGVIISVGGRSGTVTEWARRTGISRSTIRHRLNPLGWAPEAAVTTPVRFMGGVRRHPLAHIWVGMIARCCDPEHHAFKNYGGRGITVCEPWLASFWAFVEDIEETIGPRPSPRHSIDRIDNGSGYEPGNVRWATPTEQNRNRRANRILRVGGESRPVVEWAELTGISEHTLRSRLDRGWDDEAVVGTPVRHERRVLSAGERARCAELGLSWSTIRHRVLRGMSFERAITEPIQPQASSNTVLPPGGAARCVELGLSPATVHARMRRGMSFEQAITEPIARKYDHHH